MKTKICTKCKIKKSILCFYRNKETFINQCKDCRRVVTQKSYYKTIDRRKAYRKKYYFKNKKYLIEINKKWCQSHPELRKKSRQKYYQSHIKKGGLHRYENLVPACQSCNSSKGILMPDIFIARQRKKLQGVSA
jgi:5-methylcytosine-specific restriction endonuclease McrA